MQSFSGVVADRKERAEGYREIAERLWWLAQRPGVKVENRRDLGVIADQFEQQTERIEEEVG